MRRALLLAAAAFVIGAAPSEASCVDQLRWHGQIYLSDSSTGGRASVWLTDKARLPSADDCGPVLIYIGETKPRPKPYRPPRMESIRAIVGVPPTIAVLRDGRVYRNLEPLAALTSWTCSARPFC
ncbi:hypothetical protein OJ998_06495 [Solirubrobacter taibaiensis]|nr:hypothetical protein [Solirubrobacter taibaiensis]